MSDFTSGFWEIYIATLTVVSILGCAVLLWMQTTKRVPGGKIDTTGHVWDEDLQEWNNPLPNWWRWLFYITVVFSLIYLVFYPGLGFYAGSLGWTQTKQYEDEVKKADAAYGPIYAKYAAMDIEKVAADREAMTIGQNLYLNYCAQCHASDARGAR
jgi:cytochrome c oxidase cbb3-type subunit 3